MSKAYLILLFLFVNFILIVFFFFKYTESIVVEVPNMVLMFVGLLLVIIFMVALGFMLSRATRFPS